MKRIAGLLIAAGLVLNGCVAKSEPEPAYQAEKFSAGGGLPGRCSPYFRICIGS